MLLPYPHPCRLSIYIYDLFVPSPPPVHAPLALPPPQTGTEGDAAYEAIQTSGTGCVA